jgi:excisionase family DNA binding protein
MTKQKVARRGKQMKGFTTRKNDSRRAYSLGEVGEMYGISRDSVKRLAKNGGIKVIRVGARILVPASEVDRMEREGAIAEVS